MSPAHPQRQASEEPAPAGSPALCTTAGAPAVEVRRVTHRYGDRVALDDLSFTVGQGEIFGLLGPNGGGKTTLFGLLSTLAKHQEGEILIFGRSVRDEVKETRRAIGVVFQSPSLDPQLTVAETMRCQARLYGLREVASRGSELLERFDLASRGRERVASLSGGTRRRLEIAKALLHLPRLLVLDEPSTGLDPGIRRELWSILEELRGRQGVTVLLTTHFMEEGDRCDRVGLLDRGRLAALGEPEALKSEVGGEVVRLRTADPTVTASVVRERFGVEAVSGPETVQFELEAAHEKVVELVGALGERVRSITVARPSLEDVFLRRTGRSFWQDEVGEGDAG